MLGQMGPMWYLDKAFPGMYLLKEEEQQQQKQLTTTLAQTKNSW